MYYTQKVENYTLIIKKEENKNAKIISIIEGDIISEEELVRLLNSGSWNMVSTKQSSDGSKFFVFDNGTYKMIVKYYYVAECAILTSIPESSLSAASSIIGYKYITKKRCKLDKFDKVTKKAVNVVKEYLSC